MDAPRCGRFCGCKDVVWLDWRELYLAMATLNIHVSRRISSCLHLDILLRTRIPNSSCYSASRCPPTNTSCQQQIPNNRAQPSQKPSPIPTSQLFPPHRISAPSGWTRFRSAHIHFQKGLVLGRDKRSDPSGQSFAGEQKGNLVMTSEPQCKELSQITQQDAALELTAIPNSPSTCQAIP